AARRPARARGRSQPPLPRDLPHHPALGLHGHRRRSPCMTATSIATDRVGATAILRIAGDITSASEAELAGAYGGAVDGGATAVVLDFSGMEYMNSGGIGLLVTLLVRAQRGGARLLAMGLSDHYR